MTGNEQRLTELLLKNRYCDDGDGDADGDYNQHDDFVDRFTKLTIVFQLEHETSILKQTIIAAEQQRDSSKSSNHQLQATVIALQASLNERCRDLSSSVALQSTTAADNRCHTISSAQTRLFRTHALTHRPSLPLPPPSSVTFVRN